MQKYKGRQFLLFPIELDHLVVNCPFIVINLFMSQNGMEACCLICQIPRLLYSLWHVIKRSQLGFLSSASLLPEGWGFPLLCSLCCPGLDIRKGGEGHGDTLIKADSKLRRKKHISFPFLRLLKAQETVAHWKG